jgi:hypothetical protein
MFGNEAGGGPATAVALLSHRLRELTDTFGGVEVRPETRHDAHSASPSIDADRADSELITAVEVLEQAKAACAALQARLTARFVDSRSAAAKRMRVAAATCADAGDFDGWVAARDEARALELEPERRGARHADGAARSSGTSRRMTLSRSGVAAQVALARRESPSRGARLANASVVLVRDLPNTLAALAAGVLNERRAEIVVRGTSHLERDLRSRVDAEVVGAHFDPDDPMGPGGVASWGDHELEHRVRACADHLDAAAAVERARVAERERRVTIRPVPDTMAVVSAVLPVAQAVAVHAALTRAALTGKASGDERGKGQIMADTLVERVTGQAAADDVSVEVQLVITDRALVAGDGTPAQVPGYGPVPAGWARDLLTRHLPGGHVPGDDPAPGDVRARLWLRRLYTHPASGSLVAMDSTRRLFPAAVRRFVVARDGTCRTPWCDAPIAHADHVTPHAEGGPTSAANGQGLCVRCNLVKEEPGWTTRVVSPGPTASSPRPHTVEVTTPTGRPYISVAPPLIAGLGPPSADVEHPPSLCEARLNDLLAG